MVSKLKAKIIPSDCEHELFKRLKSLKYKDMTVKHYAKEF